MTTFSGGLSVKAIPKSCIGATQSLTYTYSTASMPPSPTLLPSLCRDDILAAVKEQKGLFEGATRPRIKAQESQKLLAMLFYTALPPGRAKEFQTLHVAIHDKLPMPVVDQARPNCLYITTDGRQAYLLLADYKTHKSYGDHFLPLDDDSQLLSHLVIHLSHHREVLLGAGQQTTALFLVSTRHTYNYIYGTPMHVYTTTGITAITITVQLSFSNSILSLVQNDRGAPYSASSWTAYIEGIFERHIAKKIGPTLLRSIFVTHCEKSNLSEAEKESMATAMQHSRRAVSKH